MRLPNTKVNNCTVRAGIRAGCVWCFLLRVAIVLWVFGHYLSSIRSSPRCSRMRDGDPYPDVGMRAGLTSS